VRVLFSSGDRENSRFWFSETSVLDFNEMENSALHRRINEILEENRQLQKEREVLLQEKTAWCQEKLKILGLL